MESRMPVLSVSSGPSSGATGAGRVRQRGDSEGGAESLSPEDGSASVAVDSAASELLLGSGASEAGGGRPASSSQGSTGSRERSLQQGGGGHRRSASGVSLGAGGPTPASLRDPMDAPVRKLSVNLIRTYKYINQVYYEKKKQQQQEQAAAAASSSSSSSSATATASGAAASHPPVASSAAASANVAPRGSGESPKAGPGSVEPGAGDEAAGAGAASALSASAGASAPKKRLYNNGHDDENSDYIIRIGEKLMDRYVVKQKIGKGSFGQVVRAYDERSGENVAIKIIKSRRPFFQQAKTEIALLSELNRKDPEDKWFVVRLLDTFVHHSHQCLVFEMLSYNLYDLLRNTQFYGVSLNLIRKFARQILKALFFLAREDVDIVHSDLKPENLLLRHPKRSAIKVIDFGSSCKSDKQMYSYIQSRFYRSPEVILGRPYSVAIDMWSLGCILVEMHTGEPLFSGSDEHDQVIRLVAVRGMPPEEMLASANKTSQFFERRTQREIEQDGADSPYGKSSWKLLPRTRGEPVEDEIARHKRTLPQILGLGGTSGPAARRSGEAGHSREMYDLFLDLIDRMLQYDPERRIDPKAALNHPFILSDSQNIVRRQPSRGSAGASHAVAAGPPVAPQHESQQQLQQLQAPATSSFGVSKRPGSAPAAAGGNATLRRSSRVAKQQQAARSQQGKAQPPATGKP